MRMGQVTLSCTGKLALDGKCLMLRRILEGGAPNNEFLAWLENYGLNVQDGTVEVLDKAGRGVG